MVKSLANDLNRGCSLTAQNALGQLSVIIQNRTSVKQEAEAISSLTTNASPVADELARAMDTSINADTFWSAWFADKYEPWRIAGCQGNVPTNGDASWDQFSQFSTQSTTAKQQLLNDYNANAGDYGLKNDWQVDDI